VPTFTGQYPQIFGVDNPWKSTGEKDSAIMKAAVLTVVFLFCAICDTTAIIRSITSKPGGIPEDREWDMVSDSATASEGEGAGGFRSGGEEGHKDE